MRGAVARISLNIITVLHYRRRNAKDPEVGESSVGGPSDLL